MPRQAPEETHRVTGHSLPRGAHPTLQRSALLAETREALVQLHRVGRCNRWVGSKRWLCSGLLIRRDEGSIPSRPTLGLSNALRAPTAIQKLGLLAETAKQVKCCGDTPVRHTGVGGFNSPHLLDRYTRLKCGLENAAVGSRCAIAERAREWSRRRHSIKCGPGRSAQAMGFHPT